MKRFNGILDDIAYVTKDQEPRHRSFADGGLAARRFRGSVYAETNCRLRAPNPSHLKAHRAVEVRLHFRTHYSDILGNTTPRAFNSAAAATMSSIARNDPAPDERGNFIDETAFGPGASSDPSDTLRQFETGVAFSLLITKCCLHANDRSANSRRSDLAEHCVLQTATGCARVGKRAKRAPDSYLGQTMEIIEVCYHKNVALH